MNCTQIGPGGRDRGILDEQILRDVRPRHQYVSLTAR